METHVSATEAVAGPRSLGLPSLNPTGPSASHLVLWQDSLYGR